MSMGGVDELVVLLFLLSELLSTFHGVWIASTLSGWDNEFDAIESISP
jgi:hypothetical protein